MTDGKSPWRNLIRFEDGTGKEHFGDAPAVDIDQLLGTEVPTLHGESLKDLERTGKSCKVEKVCSSSDARHPN